MFALSVRSLDGNSQHMTVSPSATVASLCAQLELARALPAFHETKLFYGTHELVDNVPTVIEVQAVNRVSSSKLLVALGRRWDDKERLSAIALLGEQTDLSRDFCEQLLSIDSWDQYLGAAFGRACGDPAPYFEALLSERASGDRIAAGSAALREIAKRLGASSLRARAAEIADLAQLSIDCADADLEQVGTMGVLAIADACFLLAEYGDASHLWGLRFFVEDQVPTKRTEATRMLWVEACREFPAAIERITGREEARANVVPQTSSLSDAPCGSSLGRSTTQRQAEWAGAMEVHDNEQDVKIMLALRMDEAEVLEREGADIAEAILRSKGDAAAGAGGWPDEVCSRSCTDLDGDARASNNVKSTATSPSHSAPLSSQLSGPSSDVTKVLPGQASLHAVMPHLVDGRLPSIGTVAHDNDCTACRSKARGKECKCGPVCRYCHGPHALAEGRNPGGSSRQRSIKRAKAQSWFRPPTPDPFEEM